MPDIPLRTRNSLRPFPFYQSVMVRKGNHIVSFEANLKKWKRRCIAGKSVCKTEFQILLQTKAQLFKSFTLNNKIIQWLTTTFA